MSISPMKAAVCDAVVSMHGDEDTVISLSCQLVTGHTGAHCYPVTACEPPAELTWWDL